jgi:hypothetical protein
VLVDRARSKKMSDPFEAARRTLRWLYQFVVWNDFIKRVTIEKVRSAALKLEDTADGRKKWELVLKDVYSWKNQPFMPVEFSVAAYRFGHSMVRNEYQTNQSFRGVGNFAPLFDDAGTPDDLRGFRPIDDGTSFSGIGSSSKVVGEPISADGTQDRHTALRMHSRSAGTARAGPNELARISQSQEGPDVSNRPPGRGRSSSAPGARARR